MNFQLSSSFKVISTSEAGDRLAIKENIPFQDGSPDGIRVVIKPDILKQKLQGIGSSFTESSAFVLAHLSTEKRQELMKKIYGQTDGGAGFTLTRTHIGSCDFCVEGKYCYQTGEKDEFSINPDTDGFKDKAAYPRIQDRNYDLLPMIQEALQINPEIKIIASAWTAPPWMKDINDFFIKGKLDESGDWQMGTGGRLQEEHYPSYTRYIQKYIQSYEAKGVTIWAVTPVNEPLGNSGSWESMHWSAEEEAGFIRNHLGPALKNSDVRILPYDQNRGQELKEWADVIYADPKTAEYVFGMAVHWYSSTVDARTESLDYAHQKAPDKTIIHSEGCIDALGTPAPPGIGDPIGFQEKGWWMNDSFWWNKNATDWAYTANYGDWMNADDHPIYTPVHRYARNIIDSLNHWVSGWVDWNIILNRVGGPNHVGNFCGAPIMIDTEAENPDQAIHFTPVFYTLAQFSRNIRPGDRVVSSEILNDKQLADDDLHALATLSNEGCLSVHLLNTTKKSLAFSLQIGDQFAPVTMDANSLRTIKLKLVRED